MVGSYVLTVEPSAERQTLEGWGACFNELGWEALSVLSDADRESVLGAIWSPTAGLGLTYNRVPIGASDYADGWYSHDELPAGETEDLAQERFSIARDEGVLLPYILAASRHMDDVGSDSDTRAAAADGDDRDDDRAAAAAAAAAAAMPRHLFASAWSPPTWMKLNGNYSGCPAPAKGSSEPTTNALNFTADVQAGSQ